MVAAAARHLDRPRSCRTEGIRLTSDPFQVVDDPETEIIVELIGGYEPARELVLRAIDNGKHVVTANKALIALHGNEIFARARDKGVTVVFEAAVAGGIPIIKAVREGLTGNRIQWLAGIINGTANYIFTEMFYAGREFGEVLAEAQRLGYAEADPTFDVEGIDAAHKLTILASIAFGIPLQFDKVHVEGIAHVTAEDVGWAEELGYRIKHLGICVHEENGYSSGCTPTLLPQRHMLANVDGVMNAVMVCGDAVGPRSTTARVPAPSPPPLRWWPTWWMWCANSTWSRRTACPTWPSSPTSCPTTRCWTWARWRVPTTFA